jgi:hypothetical protein
MHGTDGQRAGALLRARDHAFGALDPAVERV